MRSTLLTLALLSATAAAEPELRDLLRDGLYAEEVSRDAEAAARDYEKILSHADAEQPFVANALFRLAELRRKQNRKEEAIQLYQRLLTRYPDSDPQAKLSRDALATLGAALPGPAPQEPDDETREVQRLERMLADSPDVLKKPEFFLENIQKGWDRPVSFLLDHGAAANPETMAQGLDRAASIGHLGIVKRLMAHGVDSGSEMAARSFCLAVDAGNLDVVKLFLASGIKPEPGPGGKFLAQLPPLYLAARKGHLEIARLLIENGADVNRAPIRGAQGPEQLKFISASTPLIAALCAYPKHIEIVDLLLQHRADPNIDSRDDDATALALAAEMPDETGYPVVQRLLAAGADPKAKVPGERSLLERTTSVNTLRLLLDRGAPVDPVWKTRGFSTSATGIEMLKRFVFPIWSAEPRVRIIADPARYVSNGSLIAIDASNEFTPTTPIIADRDKGDSIRSLPGLLASWDKLNPWQPSSTVTLYRRTGDGTFIDIPVNLTSPDPYPDLQWGDILLVGLEYPPVSHGPSIPSGWTPAVHASLETHTMIPVTIEYAGQKKELVLRGDCLVYDPTKQVAPWKNIYDLVWSISGMDANLHPPVIYRAGVAQASKESDVRDPQSYMLWPGDRLVIPSPTDPTEIRKERNSLISVTSPGCWFTRHIRAEPTSTPPTLMQAIATTYPVVVQQKDFKWSAEAEGRIVQKNRELGGIGLLPHPDFSHLRIRRLREDGTDMILEVDLEKAAAACTPDTSPATARKIDQDLLAGDIVEIPMMPGTAALPWLGFTDQERLLFSKALSGNVTISIGETQHDVHLSYHSPRMVQTPGGTIAVATDETPTQLTVHDFLETIRPASIQNIGRANQFQEQLSLRRKGQTLTKDNSSTFLRDGDIVVLALLQQPHPVIIPGSGRTPRQKP